MVSKNDDIMLHIVRLEERSKTLHKGHTSIVNEQKEQNEKFNRMITSIAELSESIKSHFTEAESNAIVKRTGVNEKDIAVLKTKVFILMWINSILIITVFANFFKK